MSKMERAWLSAAERVRAVLLCDHWPHCDRAYVAGRARRATAAHVCPCPVTLRVTGSCASSFHSEQESLDAHGIVGFGECPCANVAVRHGVALLTGERLKRKLASPHWLPRSYNGRVAKLTSLAAAYVTVRQRHRWFCFKES